MDVLGLNVRLSIIRESWHFPARTYCHPISHFYRIADPWPKRHFICQRKQHARHINDRDHQSDRIRLTCLSTNSSRIKHYPQLGLLGRWILEQNQQLQIRNQSSLPDDEASPNQHISCEVSAILPDKMQHLVRMHLPQQKSNILARNFHSLALLRITLIVVS